MDIIYNQMSLVPLKVSSSSSTSHRHTMKNQSCFESKRKSNLVFLIKCSIKVCQALESAHSLVTTKSVAAHIKEPNYKLYK